MPKAAVYVANPCPVCGTPVRKLKGDYERLKRTSKKGWSPACCPSHAAIDSQRRRRAERLWRTNS